MNDLRFAFRQLRKSPGFTAVALLSLALGIGANSAIFTVVKALWLRPLPGVQEPRRLMAIYTSDSSGPLYGASSYPDYLEMREKFDVFSGLMAYGRTELNLSAGSQTEVVRGEVVTANYFSVLGVTAAAGRLFVPPDLTAQPF